MVDFSKIGKRSRRKGKGFEREIKEMISKALKIPKEYIEKPIEWGGQPLGDIFTVGKHWEKLPIFIEAKKREQWQLHQVFTNPDTNPLVKWWLKTSNDMPEEDKNNLMLVFSKNYFPILCMLPSDRFEDLTKGCDFQTEIKFYTRDLDKEFVIVLFRDFLKARAILYFGDIRDDFYTEEIKEKHKGVLNKNKTKVGTRDWYRSE